MEIKITVELFFIWPYSVFFSWCVFLQNAQNEDEANKISKKKLKKLTRLSVAQLKQVSPLPFQCSYAAKTFMGHYGTAIFKGHASFPKVNRKEKNIYVMRSHKRYTKCFF